MKESTKNTLINIFIGCMIWSIIGTIIIIVETWFPFGDWVYNNFGLFGKTAGQIAGLATWVGWFGWLIIGLSYIKEKWGIDLL